MSNSVISRAKIIYLLLYGLSLPFQTIAQSLYGEKADSQLTIAGTSTLRAWTLTTKKAEVKAEIDMDAESNLREINSLIVIIPVESLKSGYSAMDRNTYSALDADEYKHVKFVLTTSNVQSDKIRCSGYLTIAGTEKQISLTTQYARGVDNSLNFSGTIKLKMSDFNIEPPSFMFGTVTTDDEVTIEFKIKMKKEVY